MQGIAQRLVLRGLPVLLVGFFAVLSLLPAAPASAAPSALKTCTLTGANVYTCTFTITPSVAAVAGDAWLVQMVTPGPGTFTGPPTVTSATDCVTVPGIASPGSFISTPSGTADYDVTIGSGGCLATATVVITETVTVTASGQICQRVWVNAAFTPVTSCDTVQFFPQPSAEKTCTLTPTPNLYTCLFTVTPAFPAVAGDLLHINEAPGPLMTGPATIIPTPTVGTVIGCNEVPSPVVQSGSTSYNAQIGVSGCPGTTWSVQFIETIAVTASGQICQSFWMVAAVPPVTSCATVNFAKSLPGAPAPGKFGGSMIAPSGVSLVIFGGGSLADLVAAANDEGAISVWATVDGAFRGLFPGAPSFVSASFNAAFPDGTVPDGTIFLIVR